MPLPIGFHLAFVALIVKLLGRVLERSRGDERHSWFRHISNQLTVRLRKQKCDDIIGSSGLFSKMQ
jgi:hypothetical protein